MEHNMSGNNVAHVSSVDKGLKMKIKRTKGPNKVDSKHEVVKTDSLSKSATPSPGQSMVSVAVTMLPSSAATSSPMISAVTTASGSGNSTSFILQTTASSLLLPPVSSSAIISPSSNNTASSLATMTAGNPTVALLKAVTAGIMSEVYSSNSVAAANKSPLKMVPPSTHGADHKDGKSHKLKAAYNKKVKDIKGKPDGLLTIGSPCSMSGPHIPNVDSRTCVGLASSSQSLNSSPSPFQSLAGVINSTVTSEPRPGDTVHMKRENPVHDPYEFNAKVEDKIELPPKKLKLEKADCIETAISPQPPQPQQHSSSPGMLQPPPPPPKQQHPHKRSIGVDVRSVGVVTEPDALGPCEPGTLVGLEGIVWKETDNGLLVVNVTWRGKTYVGTLMDATRYAWAPPRPNGCESPVSDFEPRAPKGRGKRNCRNSVQSNERLPEGRRLRKGRRGTVNSSSSNFTAPPSPAKSDVSTSNLKRKTKTNDLDSDKHKRSRSSSGGVTGAESPTADGYIICPEPNCHKKYKHMNGLRYHRTHAHRKSSLTDDAKDDEEEDEDDEEKQDKKSTVLDRTERIKSKERQKVKEQQGASGRDSKDLLDDDIPLKEIASKVSGQISVHKLDAVGTGKEKSEEESSSNSNDGSSSSITAPSVSSKGDPQVVLTKADIPGQKESLSPSIFCTPTPKKKDLNLVDVPISSVPCVSPNQSPVVVSSDADNISVSAIATVRSRVCSTSSNVVEEAVCPDLSVISSQTLPQNSACGQGSTTALASVHGITNTAKSSAFMKSTTSTRLIVPVPPHQMSSLNHSHPHNMSSMSPMQGLGSLKPIQPKPTVMGDFSSIGPALSDLAKEKHRKPKKKKDITEAAKLVSANPCPKIQGPSRDSSSSLSDLSSHNDLYKCERTAVIKSSNPSKTYEDSSPINDLSKLSFHSSLHAHKLQCSLNSETSLTVGSRVAVPPSTLPVSSSAESKSTINDDVHSPAYSDISDANDSSSPLQQDSPKKDSSLKKDGQHNGPTHIGPDNSSLPQHYGNIFYYGGPHYAPHGINSQMSSPTLSDGLIKKENAEEKRPSSSNEHMLDKNDGARCAQEADLQQKSLINYFAHLHGVSPTAMQLQYNLASYNPTPMDSSYATLAQQALDQQKRLMQHHEMAGKAEDGLGKRTPSGTPSSNRPMRSGFDSSGKHNVVADAMEGQYDQRRPGGDRDHTMREKHGDIHHSLKENNELKSQLGSNSDQQTYHAMKQQHNDLIRAQMYQQQRQKMYENHRQDKRKTPPELTNTGAHIPTSISRNQSDSKSMELIPHDMIKKEVVHHKESSRLEAIDSKRFDIKEESIKPGQAPSTLDLTSKSRSPSQSNIPLVNSASSSSLSLPAAASLPVSLIGPLPSTAAGFPYTPYYPHFRPVQLDSMYRALSPHIIGYASAPQGFIHPTQLGYRMPVVETDGKSTDAVDSSRGDGPGLVNSPGYTPSHKIHELHDKGRPSPGVNSPAPSKSASGDNLSSSERTTPGPPAEKVKDKQREYSSSPPTQRHVHTHHHTHVMSGFPPLYTPDAYTMFGHPAAAAAAAIQTGPHPFPPPPPPPAPKS